MAIMLLLEETKNELEINLVFMGEGIGMNNPNKTLTV